MSTTTYNSHWRETTNLTVSDSTGKSEKTSGAAGSFNASARLGQMFDGISTVVLEATIAAIGEMAVGIYAINTAYSSGAVTVASLLACWHVDASNNAIVKESGVTKFTQAGAVNTDILRITLTGAGVLTYHYNGVLKFTSLISTATVQGWRPWRAVVTHSASNSKFDPVQVTGESSEYYDRDLAGSTLAHEYYDQAGLEVALECGVHTPETGGVTDTPHPYARAFVM